MPNRNAEANAETKKRRHKSQKTKVVLLGFLVLALIAGSYGLYRYMQDDSQDTPAGEVILNQDLAAEQQKTGTLKTFTGKQFRDLYNSYAYPNTEYIAEDAVITGDQSTDTAIRQMAEKRGYIRRSAPVQDTFIEVESLMLLQERAAWPWEELKAKAKQDGIDLFLTAAYRSAEEQRSIFLERLAAINLTSDLIISGSYNDKVGEILASTAIPGYSRHHTGYTIDIGCGNDPDNAFEFTVCFEWLSTDNYKNAKTYGWIPSYPEGAGQQGPEPETWEYVWVGLDAVTE